MTEQKFRHFLKILSESFYLSGEDGFIPYLNSQENKKSAKALTTDNILLVLLSKAYFFMLKAPICG